jgi:hypothetical protein
MDRFLTDYLSTMDPYSITPDPTNENLLIFTRNENFYVPFDGPDEIRKIIKDTTHPQRFNYGDYDMPNYGFLRAICDKSGKILAYTRAKRLFPDPFPTQFRTGQWYAFEEYNQKLIKGFTYTACESENGSLGEWTYDPKMRSYTLNIPNSMLENKHYFLVRNKNIITDYGDSDYRIYKYNGKKDKIDETTEMIITAGMIDSGIIQKKEQVREKRNILQGIVQKLKNRLH